MKLPSLCSFNSPVFLSCFRWCDASFTDIFAAGAIWQTHRGPFLSRQSILRRFSSATARRKPYVSAISPASFEFLAQHLNSITKTILIYIRIVHFLDVLVKKLKKELNTFSFSPPIPNQNPASHPLDTELLTFAPAEIFQKFFWQNHIHTPMTSFGKFSFHLLLRRIILLNFSHGTGYERPGFFQRALCRLGSDFRITDSLELFLG